MVRHSGREMFLYGLIVIFFINNCCHKRTCIIDLYAIHYTWYGFLFAKAHGVESYRKLLKYNE